MADNQLLPGYLIVGADELKRSTAVDRMKARLEKTGMADFNIDERDLSKDAPVDDVIASLNTLPMGTDFRLVILLNCDRLPKAVSEPLVDYFKNPSPTTVCLVVAEKLAKNTRLYKAMAKLGAKAVVDCAPKKAWELPRQVVSMAGAHGKTMDMEAAEELVSRAGENTRLLDNEVKRLAQQVAGAIITREDVERLVVRTAEAKPWPLLDAVSARDMRRALENLRLQPDKSEVLLTPCSSAVSASSSLPRRSTPGGSRVSLPRRSACSNGRSRTMLPGLAGGKCPSSPTLSALPST